MPAYTRYPAGVDPATIVDEIVFPCVVKPLLLSGSRGVIRADNAAEFVLAFARTRKVLEGSGMAASENFILVEQFVPGVEVALEGLLTNGVLETLALFDKPDPLDGPFFEETIYVTPSRLDVDVHAAISQRTSEAAAAIGIRHGPVHAELRIDLPTGNIWLIELAGRSIGGLCSSVLEFGAGMGLEELILRHAAAMPIVSTERAHEAAGVMMIPIPKGGMLRAVEGCDEALAVPHVTGVEITAPLNQPIVPLPEGESYLGFIFARANTPEVAEQALRDAHERLRIRIDPADFPAAGMRTGWSHLITPLPIVDGLWTRAATGSHARSLLALGGGSAFAGGCSTLGGSGRGEIFHHQRVFPEEEVFHFAPQDRPRFRVRRIQRVVVDQNRHMWHPEGIPLRRDVLKIRCCRVRPRRVASQDRAGFDLI